MNNFTITTNPMTAVQTSYAAPVNREVLTSSVYIAMPEPAYAVRLVGAYSPETIIVTSDPIEVAPYILGPSFSMDSGLTLAIDGEGTYTTTEVTVNGIYKQTIDSQDGTIAYNNVRSGMQNTVEISCLDVVGRSVYDGDSNILCLMDAPMVCSEEEDGASIKIVWSYPRTNPDIIETVNVYFYNEGMQYISKVSKPFTKGVDYVILDTYPANALYAKITFGAQSMETDFSRLVKI